MTKVSILIPVYNTENFLSQAIESVLNQTFTNWELIILDDCSTDKSFSIAQDFVLKEKRIRIFKNEQNLGMMRNWNKGISLCQSELYAKLDADDLWHPSMLQESIDAIEREQEAVMVCTNYINIDEKGRIVEGTESAMPEFAQGRSFTCVPLVQKGPAEMLKYDILRQGVSIIKRRVFDEIGAYRFLESEDTQASVDTEMYFRIGCHYQIVGINKTLYNYRVHQNSISSTDRIRSLEAKKLYEVKKAIVGYYFQYNKISKKTYLKFNKSINFLYNTHLIYHNRIKKNYFQSLELFFQCFLSYPIKTFIFYFKRIIDF